MTSQQDIDIIITALTLYREARGELEAVRIGVACVIRNRVHARWISDQTYQDVCVHPWQFSGMTAPGDPNLIKWPRSPDGAWLGCLAVAEGIVKEQTADTVAGAVFYHDISLPGPPDGWGQVLLVAQLGRIKFYRGI
jgi:N-acetylmuramoyl-L-alanine amidase